jgi:predicted ATPase/DNA-binding SARP family transcriptional activator
MEFRLLGSLEVLDDGKAVPIPGRKERALLSLLLLEANAVVPAETLIDRLWGERPPRTAANTLQVYVGRLRKLLARDALVFEGGAYGLRLEADELDTSRFERLARTGGEALAADRPNQAAKLLRGALEVWRGPPLPEFRYEDWAQAEIARLEELRQTVFEDTVEADLRLGRHAQAVVELEASVGESPLRERLHGQLVLALYRCGRQADALEVYGRLRSRLRDELGLDPSPELQALQTAILNHDPVLAAPATAPQPRPLPEPPTQLVGRQAELDAGLRLLRDQHVRLLTLTGPGGIGKTRLGLALARILAPAFADGAAFVSLASIADPELVAGAIVQALELKETRPSPEEVLAEELRRAELLLLVDNFEQVVASAPVLARLLEAAPGLAILVTSRAPLRVAGEHELPVPPLTSPAAVELFVERARAANPDFPVSETAAEVEELCSHLDGLPLAIELAAARTRMLSPRALLERLGKRLDLLGSGRRDAPDRQQTLRTTIDWSYDLLGDADQRLFARLGSFAGGWSLDAAETICAEEGVAVLDALSALVNESLILRSPESDARFLMLEIVREYAVERLAASGEAAELRRRHAQYFLELAGLAEAELHGPGQGAWIERIELELDNLRAADIFWRESSDGESRLRAVVALRRFWQLHGHLAEGLRMTEGALAQAPAADPLLRSQALNSAGLLAAEQGEFESARTAFDQALELARELGDQSQIAAALANLGNLAFFEGNSEEARRLYRESLETALALGDLRRQAVACENLGLLELDGDRPGEAVQLLQEAVASARSSGDEHQVASSLRALAAARLEMRELECADDHLGESLELAQRIGDLIIVAQGLETAAGIAGVRGDAERAAHLFGAADAVREGIGVIRPPDEQSFYERWLGTTLGLLETAAYTRLYEQGRALSLEQACALALGRRLASV